MTSRRAFCWFVPLAVLLGGCALLRKPVAVEPAAPPAPPAAVVPAAPAPVALTVSPDKVLAPVNHGVLNGFNFGNWMQVADYGEDLRVAKPAELRFPGGNIGDEQDLTDYSLGFFQAALSMLGNPLAVIQTRVFGGNKSSKGPPRNEPEDAADAVRWARAKGIKVRYWEIGNEPDLFAVTRGDTSWTPEKYCEVFRAQAAAMKKVDPTLLVAGPAVSGAKPIRDQFLEAFVKGCGDVVDVLTWHIYPTDGTMDDEGAFATIGEIDDTVDAFRALWADPARNPRGHGRKIQLGVTEYGLSWQSPRMHHLADLPAAMWAMEAALRLDERGLDSTHYFAFQATGGHGLLDVSGVRRPTWYAFTLLARLSGNLVPAATGDADIWSHAALDGNRLDVVLTNRATTAKELPVVVPGFQLQSAEYFDGAIVSEESPPAAIAPAPKVKLPARSVVHLVYARG
jgi:hypothetical protein